MASYLVFLFSCFPDSSSIRQRDEPLFGKSNPPPVVSPVADHADHDRSCRRRIDRLAPAQLGQQSLFSARHFHQLDQVDHRAAGFLHHCGRNRGCGRIKKSRPDGRQSSSLFRNRHYRGAIHWTGSREFHETGRRRGMRASRAFASHAVSASSAAVVRVCADAFALLAADHAASAFLTWSTMRLSSSARIPSISNHLPWVSNSLAMRSANDKRSLTWQGRVWRRIRGNWLCFGATVKHLECRMGRSPPISLTAAFL